ncbi:hypothetical protein REPUB_Repub03eG0068600 [Reevesia pubescens]
MLRICCFDNGECNGHGAKIPSFVQVPSLAGDYPETEHFSPNCGVVMDDVSLCRRQPVSGRKRCDLHKGRRICSSNSEKTRYLTLPYVVCDSYDNQASRFDKKSSEIFITGKVETGVAPQRPVSNKGCNTLCGVELGDGYFCTKQPVRGRVKGCNTLCGMELGDGYFCTKQPVRGRVKCEEHKGMRVTSLLSGLDARNTFHVFHDSLFNSHKWNYGSNSSSTSICGATTCNGSFCQRIVKENGRCWQHLNYDCGCSM